MCHFITFTHAYFEFLQGLRISVFQNNINYAGNGEPCGIAIEYCRKIGEDNIWEQVKLLSDYLRKQLSSVAKVSVLDRGPELGGLITFTVKDSQPTFIVDELLKRKINIVPSYRNFAVIDFDEKQVEWALRASPHYYNTIEEIDNFVESVKEIIS
ncbi:MAG TPA: aminotransferase class V-fold PLP-dependent enzyme [Pseudosphingobacterium sp.]|jgi:selenocysteine lyase/cysteine desulfurase|nr:aminotransferase class V-fold PLP-dependent enzyme [Pseudosphingobacterium sp.]